LASGENHVKGTVLIAVPTGILAMAGGAGLLGGIACSLGCLAGVILSPDLDVEHRTRSEYLVYRYLGRFLGAAWFAFWWPYARLIPHRHPFSHWPVMGTLLRIAYMYVLGGILWFGATWVVIGQGSWMPLAAWLQNDHFVWGILGLVAADSLHFLMDVLPFWREDTRQTRHAWFRH
jgi:uncharacterized metal-binding protein